MLSIYLMMSSNGRKPNVWNEFQRNCTKGGDKSTREFAKIYKKRADVLRQYLTSCEERSPDMEYIWHLFEKGVRERQELVNTIEKLTKAASKKRTPK